MDMNKAISVSLAKAGMSAKEVAEKSGINKATISLIRKNKRSPSVKTLSAIAAAMGMELSDLIKEGEK